jgi:hypothetical protein
MCLFSKKFFSLKELQFEIFFKCFKRHFKGISRGLAPVCNPINREGQITFPVIYNRIVSLDFRIVIKVKENLKVVICVTIIAMDVERYFFEFFY